MPIDFKNLEARMIYYDNQRAELQYSRGEIGKGLHETHGTVRITEICSLGLYPAYHYLKSIDPTNPLMRKAKVESVPQIDGTDQLKIHDTGDLIVGGSDSWQAGDALLVFFYELRNEIERLDKK